MAEFVKVAKTADIPKDTGFHVESGGRDIALFKVDGKVYAIDAVCAHSGGPLAEGGLHGKEVMCPWHGWQFDVTTGECSFNPSVKQATFKVKDDGEDIYISIDAP
ncbi:MAG: Rieske (2Fe-2S) protein [Candidatus Omnitrophota bacterium]|nr:Rieske (2Fe-2S) protein [Candidatus Omnitrophota bacterium]